MKYVVHNVKPDVDYGRFPVTKIQNIDIDGVATISEQLSKVGIEDFLLWNTFFLTDKVFLMLDKNKISDEKHINKLVFRIGDYTNFFVFTDFPHAQKFSKELKIVNEQGYFQLVELTMKEFLSIIYDNRKRIDEITFNATSLGSWTVSLEAVLDNKNKFDKTQKIWK